MRNSISESFPKGWKLKLDQFKQETSHSYLHNIYTNWITILHYWNKLLVTGEWTLLNWVYVCPKSWCFLQLLGSKHDIPRLARWEVSWMITLGLSGLKFCGCVEILCQRVFLIVARLRAWNPHGYWQLPTVSKAVSQKVLHDWCLYNCTFPNRWEEKNGIGLKSN